MTEQTEAVTVEDHTPAAATGVRRSVTRPAIAVGAALIIIAFLAGILVGHIITAHGRSAATAKACRMWQGHVSAANDEVRALSRAVGSGGFSGNPGARYKGLLAAAEKSASVNGLDGRSFAAFTDLARRIAEGKNDLTPSGGALPDRTSINNLTSALENVTVVCHNAN